MQGAQRESEEKGLGRNGSVLQERTREIVECGQRFIVLDQSYNDFDPLSCDGKRRNRRQVWIFL